jgi:threonine/homoserine/homoserine lactone efflux protein
MGRLDSFTPAKAAAAGVALSALNPKNLSLIVAGMAAIAQTGIPGGEQAVALIAFTLIASVGVAAPVVISLAMGERADLILASLKDWMARNNGVIMAVLLLVIGVKLVGDAISALW